MANLDKLPPIGATLFIGAINVGSATGGLVRPMPVWSDDQLPGDQLPQLTGKWKSRSPEPIKSEQGVTRYLVRQFAFEENPWSIEFQVYADQVLDTLLLSGHNNGTCEIKNERAEDGSFYADFHFDEGRLTPGNEATADALTAAGCGIDKWSVNESQQVLAKGCEAFRVYSKAKCKTEFDVVRINGSMLYLGNRPPDGFMCGPSARPKAAGASSLV